MSLGFKRLKTPTCFGSFVIHPQKVLKVLNWNYLWYFCVRSRCLAAWFLECNMKSNVKFVRCSSKIANLDNNRWSGSGLLSKLTILELYGKNLTLLFILRSKKSRCQTPTTHTKISQVISVKHVQNFLKMDHKWSETCFGFLIVF